MNVEIIDINLSGLILNNAETLSYYEKIDVFGIMFNEVNIRYAYITALKIRHLKKNHKIIAFGSTATLDHEKILNRKIADVCILGEAEMAFVDIINFYQQKQGDISKVKGIAYLVGNQIIRNEVREYIDLDELPIPKRPVVAGVIPIMTSRGCYGNCSFCVNSSVVQFNIGKKQRFRRYQKVVEEIKYLYNQESFHTVVITDNVFSMGRDWMKGFLESFEKLDLGIKFQCAIRANDVIAKEDLLKRFVDIGLEWIEIGVESLVDRQLSLYQKEITADQNLKALEIAQNHKLGVYVNFLIFEPLLSVNEIEEMIEKIKNHVFFQKPTYILNPLSMSNVFYAYPYTKLTDYYIDNKIIDKSIGTFNYIIEEMQNYMVIQKRYAIIIKELFKFRYLYQLSTNNDQKQKVIDVFRDLFFLDLEIMEQIIVHLSDKNAHENIMIKMEGHIEVVKSKILQVQKEIEFMI